MNERRLAYLVAETAHRRRAIKDSCLVLDDTLCAHFGDLFASGARHYDHGAGTYPVAHNLVTSHYVSGQVRFPVAARIYRRYEEQTKWEFFVKQHFPDKAIPTKRKERNKFHQVIDQELLLDALVCASSSRVSN